MNRRKVLERGEVWSKRGGSSRGTWRQMLRFLSAHLQVVMNIELNFN